MKVSLVVATGAHEGRLIPITGPQFLIGRDQQCHLRPASQAISKLHCAVLVRDGKVYVQDFGSTNGTVVNDVLVQGAEVAVESGSTLRVGPLDFRFKIEKAAAVPDGTPLPGGSPETEAALAAVKAATAAAVKAPAAPPRDTTPNPARSGAVPAPGARPAPNPGAAKPASGVQPAPKPSEPPKPGDSKITTAPKSGSGENTPLTTTSESVTDEEQERIAAMLLGMDDAGNGSVPDGSTVMDIPSPLAEMGAGKAEEKKDDKPKPAQTREEMSTAANELLRKYMRRPR
jgi:predicted component of type VI protein secretion system